MWTLLITYWRDVTKSSLQCIVSAWLRNTPPRWTQSSIPVMDHVPPMARVFLRDRNRETEKEREREDGERCEKEWKKSCLIKLAVHCEVAQRTSFFVITAKSKRKLWILSFSLSFCISLYKPISWYFLSTLQLYLDPFIRKDQIQASLIFFSKEISDRFFATCMISHMINTECA